ncbi:diguanylate cyclase [Rhodoferax sp.]|uniref:sensor domain-containing diguanylate cyclase n=1 Tax=Rhodoferax sp. TaxID=50421 RepID=UPI0025FB54A5|nr:diguanylate cyclase [Rhodoferax sp.]
MVFRKNPPDTKALRQMALARLTDLGGVPGAATPDHEQMQHLLEELEIHQLELELQNDHLNSARAQLEQALNLNNELYDFSPVGNILLDADGLITKLNLTGVQMLGSERARLLGCKLGLYLAQHSRARFNAMLERARAEHEAQVDELDLQIDGQVSLPVQLRVVWIGTVLGWQLVLLDLSERKRMELQLRDSEERLKLALSAVGDGVWDWQVSSGNVVVSDSYARLLGYIPGEMSKNLSENLDLVVPDDKPALVQLLQDCITRKIDHYRNEQRMLCKDGRVIWVLSRGAVVLRSADGQALRMVGTLVDITRNKQTEAALAEAAKFQQAVLDSTSSQIAVLDQAGTVQQTNAAWRNYAAALNFESSVGANYLTLLSERYAVVPATLVAVAEGMAALVAGDASNFHVLEPLQCKCKRCWFTVKITPVQDSAQRLVVTHEDVSVLKQAELASQALANVDNLTGATSRQHFMSLADQELARARRYELPLVVLMLDLDHFKNVNDRYGHATGDAVLKSLVQTVKGVLRESDVVGRIGGEEFAVLLPNTTQDGGCALANRIIEAVRAHPVAYGGQLVDYRVSIGASSLTHQALFGELLAECDAALYRAKRGGRDRLEMSWNNPG